jgi:thiol-disulfide isomerase/thioredoxin
MASFAQKVIDNPSIEVSKTGIFSINKIELFENETKLQVQTKYLPNWWVDFPSEIFISDSDTGKKYNIVKVEGVEFKEKVYMPESGEQTFTLIFPPLDKNVKKIDYVNMIYGVSLTESKNEQKENEIPSSVNNWVNEELAKNQTEPLKSYDSPQFFTRKEGRLIGYIKGYDIRLGFETGIIYMGNAITREEYPIVIQIHPDGRFEGDIPLAHPIYLHIVFKTSWIPIYIEPNQTLAMILDWNEFLTADRLRNQRYHFKDIEFRGNLANINKDLSGFQQEEYDFKSFMSKVKSLTPEEFKEQEQQIYTQNLEAIDNYLTHNKISHKAELILKNENTINYSTRLFDFLMRRGYEEKKDSLNGILKVKESSSYYDFLKDMPLDENILFVSGRFRTFVNRFEYSNPFKFRFAFSGPRIKPEVTLSEFFEKENIQITDKDKELLRSDASKQQKTKEENDKFMELFSDVYKEGLKAYLEKYLKPLADAQKSDSTISMEGWRKRDSVLQNTFGLEKSLIYNVTKVRALTFDIRNSSREKALEYWDELKKDFKNDFLIGEGLRIINKEYPAKVQEGLKSNLTSSKVIANTFKLPKGRATEVFRRIIEPFKGKILFVDFWATSCAPCVSSIKRMKPTREKYEGNENFDFVFITDERSSPKKTYDAFVKEQDLKNISRLSVDDYNYLRQLFKFNGIPQYVVVGKNGDIIDDDFKMHNFDILLKGILETYN